MKRTRKPTEITKHMSDVTAKEARIEEIRNAATNRAKATVLRHALGMADPVNSLTSEYMARVIDALGDESVPDPEVMEGMFKRAKLKADMAEYLEVDSIGTSLGPTMPVVIAALEEEFDESIGEIAEDRHVDDDGYDELESILTDDTFMNR